MCLRKSAWGVLLQYLVANHDAAPICDGAADSLTKALQKSASLRVVFYLIHSGQAAGSLVGKVTARGGRRLL